MVDNETAAALSALERAALQLMNAVQGVRPMVEGLALERAVRHPAVPGSPEEVRRVYRDHAVPGLITGYDRDNRRSKWRGDFLQGVVIVGSVGVTVTTGAIGLASWLRVLTMALSFVVASSAGLSAYFKFRERAANARRAKDAIEHEVTAADLGIGRYRGRSPAEVLEMLVEEVERLREEQRQREQQLEQRPETRRDDQAVPST